MMRLHSNTLVREQLTATALSGLLDGARWWCTWRILATGNRAMAAVALGAALVEVLVFLLVRRRQRDLATAVLNVEARAQSYEVEMLTAMETLKASGSEPRAVAHWSNLYVDQLNRQIAPRPAHHRHQLPGGRRAPGRAAAGAGGGRRRGPRRAAHPRRHAGPGGGGRRLSRAAVRAGADPPAASRRCGPTCTGSTTCWRRSPSRPATASPAARPPA